MNTFKALLISVAACLSAPFATSSFAVSYGYRTVGTADVIDNVKFSSSDTVWGVYDVYGVTGGIGAGVTVDITSTGSGGYGALFYGTGSKPIADIGGIDGVIKMEANGSAGSGDVRGLYFSNARQSDGAGIAGQISAVNSNLGRNVYGIVLSGDSKAGDIASTANIAASSSFAGGIVSGLYLSDSSTVGTISGKISAEGLGSVYAINMYGDLSDLHFAGNSMVEARNTAGSAFAVRRMGALNIYGDNIGIQSFKGDFTTYRYVGRASFPATAYDMTFASGKFVFDNYNSQTFFIANDGSSNIVFASGVQADFVKSAKFTAANTSLEADFIFHAKEIGDYTNMATTTSGSVHIESAAAFLMLLDAEFTANADEFMDLLFASGTVSGSFGEENVSVAYENGRTLKYGVDYIVEHNPESDVYGRIIFLKDILVPEPSSYAAIFGALALVSVACRRRRQRI